MAQAIVDPGELKDFALSLNDYNEQLRERTSYIEGRFARLNDTWQDGIYQNFSREFDDVLRVLRQFMQTVDEHIPYLLRKADEAAVYLGH